MKLNDQDLSLHLLSSGPSEPIVSPMKSLQLQQGTCYVAVRNIFKQALHVLHTLMALYLRIWRMHSWKEHQGFCSAWAPMNSSAGPISLSVIFWSSNLGWSGGCSQHMHQCSSSQRGRWISKSGNPYHLLTMLKKQCTGSFIVLVEGITHFWKEWMHYLPWWHIISSYLMEFPVSNKTLLCEISLLH